LANRSGLISKKKLKEIKANCVKMCSIELDDAGNQFFVLIKEVFERKFAVSVPIKMYLAIVNGTKLCVLFLP